MERFAIKIDGAVKSNLYSICRLCGIDHPRKVPILDALALLGICEANDEEPDFCKKIFVCVGIKVTKNDQMPQTVCSLCADKINDFFEYREMCSATNIQTRRLLGLPDENQKPALNKKRKKVGFKDDMEGESILGDIGNDIDDKTGITDLSKSKKKQRKKGQQPPLPPPPPSRPATIIPSTSSASKFNKDRTRAAVGRPRLQNKFGSLDDSNIIKEEDKIKEEIDDKTGIIGGPSTSSGLVRPLKKVVIKKKVSGGGETDRFGVPLLTLKEPNKRERKREIEHQKKLETTEKNLNKKRKNVAFDPIAMPLKKPKPEPIVCNICNQSCEGPIPFNDHLLQSHVPNIMFFGCPSCGESFKSLDEQKDHHLWHKLSNTAYTCPTCLVPYDKLPTYLRHASHCKTDFGNAKPININCMICGQEFATQNLHDWHDCYMKNNGNCPRCNRKFSKKSVLFKHTVQCEVQRLIPLKVVLTPIDALMSGMSSITNLTSFVNANSSASFAGFNLNSLSSSSMMTSEPIIAQPKQQKPVKKVVPTKKVAEPKRKTKPPPPIVKQLVKSEPETIIDTDGNAITPATTLDTTNKIIEVPVVEPIHDDDDDAPYSPAGGDGAAGDFNDSSESDAELPESTDTVAAVGSTVTDTVATATVATVTPAANTSITIVKQEPLDDSDDVIIIEDEPLSPILIPGDLSAMKSPSPVKSKDKRIVKTKSDRPVITAIASGPNVIGGVVIKTEPKDTTETTNEIEVASEIISSPPLLVQVKLEPTDDTTSIPTANVPTEQTSNDILVAQQKRKDKKSKHKQKKDKRAPIEKKRTPPTSETAAADSQIPLLEVKQEPIDRGYEKSTNNDVINEDEEKEEGENIEINSSDATDVQLPSITIKSEPNRPEYDSFDPAVAINIKKEKDDVSDVSSKAQPASLRLKISKTHGTLNATILPHGKKPAQQKVTNKPSIKPTRKEVTASSAIVSTIDTAKSAAPSETSIHKSPTSEPVTASETPSTSSSQIQEKDSTIEQAAQKKKTKSLYKKPALLMQKIREEMMARMARDKQQQELSKESTTTSTADSSKEKDTPACPIPPKSPASMPIITQVSSGDGAQIPLPPAQISKDATPPLSSISETAISQNVTAPSKNALQVKVERADNGYNRKEQTTSDGMADETENLSQNNEINDLADLGNESSLAEKQEETKEIDKNDIINGNKEDTGEIQNQEQCLGNDEDAEENEMEDEENDIEDNKQEEQCLDEKRNPEEEGGGENEQEDEENDIEDNKEEDDGENEQEDEQNDIEDYKQEDQCLGNDEKNRSEEDEGEDNEQEEHVNQDDNRENQLLDEHYQDKVNESQTEAFTDAGKENVAMQDENAGIQNEGAEIQQEDNRHLLDEEYNEDEDMREENENEDMREENENDNMKETNEDQDMKEANEDEDIKEANEDEDMNEENEGDYEDEYEDGDNGTNDETTTQKMPDENNQPEREILAPTQGELEDEYEDDDYNEGGEENINESIENQHNNHEFNEHEPNINQDVDNHLSSSKFHFDHNTIQHIPTDKHHSSIDNGSGHIESSQNNDESSSNKNSEHNPDNNYISNDKDTADGTFISQSNNDDEELKSMIDDLTNDMVTQLNSIATTSGDDNLDQNSCNAVDSTSTLHATAQQFPFNSNNISTTQTQIVDEKMQISHNSAAVLQQTNSLNDIDLSSVNVPSLADELRLLEDISDDSLGDMSSQGADDGRNIDWELEKRLLDDEPN